MIRVTYLTYILQVFSHVCDDSTILQLLSRNVNLFSEAYRDETGRDARGNNFLLRKTRAILPFSLGASRRAYVTTAITFYGPGVQRRRNKIGGMWSRIPRRCLILRPAKNRRDNRTREREKKRCPSRRDVRPDFRAFHETRLRGRWLTLRIYRHDIYTFHIYRTVGKNS